MNKRNPAFAGIFGGRLISIPHTFDPHSPPLLIPIPHAFDPHSPYPLTPIPHTR